MNGIPVPAHLVIDATGGMRGRTGVKRSRIADLTGLYADADAFAELARTRGDETAYEVHEFRPKRARRTSSSSAPAFCSPAVSGANFS